MELGKRMWLQAEMKQTMQTVKARVHNDYSFESASEPVISDTPMYTNDPLIGETLRSGVGSAVKPKLSMAESEFGSMVQPIDPFEVRETDHEEVKVMLPSE
jgi:hypothetical protein